MKERPILFSADMVRALLAGRKTQTRRLVKPHFRNQDQSADIDRQMEIGHDSDVKDGWLTVVDTDGRRIRLNAKCPYGQPGDRLWVRERMRRIGAVIGSDNRPTLLDIKYEADDYIAIDVPFPKRVKGVPKHGQCLPYGGYREASRITLEITSVRVERLLDISEGDAQAEGVEDWGDIKTGGWKNYQTGMFDFRWPRSSFRSLWESIHGRGSSAANPYVWVIEFRRVEGGAK